MGLPRGGEAAGHWEAGARSEAKLSRAKNEKWCRHQAEPDACWTPRFEETIRDRGVAAHDPIRLQRSHSGQPRTDIPPAVASPEHTTRTSPASQRSRCVCPAMDLRQPSFRPVRGSDRRPTL